MTGGVCGNNHGDAPDMTEPPPPAHTVIHWVLECTHRVTCGCGHVIGGLAWCWFCGTDQEVTAMERENLQRP